MDEKIVRLATYSNVIEAEMAKNYLKDAGFSVFSAGGEVAGPFPGLDAGFLSVELHVPESQYETACKALESFEQHEPGLDEELLEEDTSTAFTEQNSGRSGGQTASSTDFRSGPPGDDVLEEADGSEFVRLPEEDTEDDSREDVSIQRTPDDLAARAWRASFIGLLLLPPILHIYSIWLLLQMSSMDQELSPAGMRKVYAALAIDGFVLVIAALAVLAILSRA